MTHFSIGEDEAWSQILNNFMEDIVHDCLGEDKIGSNDESGFMFIMSCMIYSFSTYLW